MMSGQFLIAPFDLFTTTACIFTNADVVMTLELKQNTVITSYIFFNCQTNNKILFLVSSEINTFGLVSNKFAVVELGWGLTHPLLLLTLVQNQVVFKVSRANRAGVAVAALVNLRVDLLVGDIVVSKSLPGVEVHVALLAVENLGQLGHGHLLHHN